VKKKEKVCAGKERMNWKDGRVSEEKEVPVNGSSLHKAKERWSE